MAHQTDSIDCRFLISRAKKQQVKVDSHHHLLDNVSNLDTISCNVYGGRRERYILTIVPLNIPASNSTCASAQKLPRSRVRSLIYIPTSISTPSHSLSPCLVILSSLFRTANMRYGPMSSEELNEIEKKYRGLDPGSLLKKDVKNRRTTWSHTTASLTGGATSVLSHGITSPYHVPVGGYHLQKSYRRVCRGRISVR